VPSTNAGFRPATNPLAAPVRTPLAPFPLVFDAESKTADVRPGQTNVTFTFKFTNTTPAEVTIDRVQTSCGCTVAKLPAMPWKLAAGTNAEFAVVADLRGKRGLFSKMVYVYTSQGFKALNIKVNLPEADLSSAAERMRNLQIAVADRQAVFKGDCARCHSDPGVGKKGRELYQAVCGVCHEAERRATVVPNLRALKHPTDAEHWRSWITHGKAGTLMPAFSQSDGGPFTQEQIDSLVAYLVENVPSRPAAAPIAPTSAPTQ
jgi:mono/diheme cytochrome c family protein